MTRRGVTLIELLVAMALLAIPLGISFNLFLSSGKQFGERHRDSDRLDSAFSARVHQRGSMGEQFQGARLGKGWELVRGTIK